MWEKNVPQTAEELIELIQLTPRTVLSQRDRERIAGVMSFDDRVVGDLMVSRDKMVFVNEKDLLGPLMLDKLYKSGFTNFPVVDNDEKVCGVIHTESLNMLEIKKTERANKYMDKQVFYLRVDDSLNYAVEEIERTNSYYFLVLDKEDRMAGFFTVQMLLDFLLGKNVV
ncbi:CBS domain-containing protein [Candidatus Saccharibacteria bacterium]|nr:CBS domain-containing protein [Candidatus Saccharibacteria bacterium]